MEILYIWINEYKNIRKKGFNFGGKYIFDYDPESNYLNISENDNYIKNFFNLTIDDKLGQINNITGIIGENGAGKSSILDFIKTKIAIKSLPKESILIFENSSKMYIYSAFKNEPELSKVFKDKFEPPINISTKELNEFVNEVHLNDMENTSFIFYSYIYDAKIHNLYDNIFDISTNALLRDDIENYYEDKKIDYSSRNFLNPIYTHRKFERKRQLQFLFSEYTGVLNFSINHDIKITVDNFDLLYLRERINVDKKENVFAKYLSDINNKLFYMHKRSINNLNDYLDFWYISVFFSYLKNYYPYTEIPSFFPDDKFDSSNIKEYVVNFLEYIKKHEAAQRNNIDRILEDINGFTNLIKKQHTLFKEIKYSSVKIGTIEANEDFLKNIADFYNIEFLWSHFSSGQFAIINLYSRFYDIAKNQRNKIKDNIVILIDEAELGFHPQWQKEYLNRIIEYFRKLFFIDDSTDTGKRDLQIILTSNSPFIASDLPKNNVIFLKRLNNMCEVVEDLEEQDQTFAANIFNLFSNSFFLQGGLIGDFAKKKIDGIINKINNSDLSNLEEGEIQMINKLINIIGEPLIRKNLQSLVKDKLNTDIISIYNKLKSIEKQITENKHA